MCKVCVINKYVLYLYQQKQIKLEIMKTFKLTIFKGHETKDTKTVIVKTKEELTTQKNGFWSESPYKNTGKNWMGVKRVR